MWRGLQAPALTSCEMGKKTCRVQAGPTLCSPWMQGRWWQGTGAGRAEIMQAPFPVVSPVLAQGGRPPSSWYRPPHRRLDGAHVGVSSPGSRGPWGL